MRVLECKRTTFASARQNIYLYNVLMSQIKDINDEKKLKKVPAPRAPEGFAKRKSKPFSKIFDIAS